MQFPAEHANPVQPQCSRNAGSQLDMQICALAGGDQAEAMIRAAPLRAGLARLPRRLFRDSRRPDLADGQNSKDSPNGKDSAWSYD